MKPKTIAITVVVALFLFILLQNMQNTPVTVLAWKVSMPRLILILTSVVVGWLAGWVSHMAYRRNKDKARPAKAKSAAAAPSESKGKETEGEKQPDL